MAKVTLNPVIEAIRGKVGDLVFKHRQDNEFVGKMPDRTGIVPTVNQLAQMAKFRLAAVYGKAVIADPQTRIVYEEAAARKGIPAFAVSLGDFLNLPAVDEIDLAGYSGKIGETIRVRASDDVEVEGVSVTIRAQGGAVLEEGPAVWTAATGTWNYTTTTALAQGQAAVIEVSATDLPGHTGTKSQTKE
jgi:hypothetical protein